MFVKANKRRDLAVDRGSCISEADVGDGLPGFSIIGTSGFRGPGGPGPRAHRAEKIQASSPALKVTVNLSPADLRKRGTALICPSPWLCILGVQVAWDRYAGGRRSMVVGELGLDGKVKPVEGVLSMVMAAREEGIKVFPAR